MTVTLLSSLEPQVLMLGACLSTYTHPHSVHTTFSLLKPTQYTTFPPFRDSFLKLATAVLLWSTFAYHKNAIFTDKVPELGGR